MSVLIVEDNPISAKAMKATLMKHGHDTAVVYTGTQALEYLEVNPQIQAAVVDLVLPEMDGFQLIRRLKRDQVLKDMPVVICTTLRDMEAVKRAQKLGCRYYIVKPVKGEDLVRKVELAMSKATAILQSKQIMMRQLEVDSDAYEDIVYTFHMILDEKMFMVQSLLDGRRSRTERIELGDLKEGASMLGADKLMLVLARFFDEGGHPVRAIPSAEEFSYLNREMVALERVLKPARRHNVVI